MTPERCSWVGVLQIAGDEPERCHNQARYVVEFTAETQHPELVCARHKPKPMHERGKYAAYDLDATRCGAILDDGLGCSNPATLRVVRDFSGVSSYSCKQHKPSLPDEPLRDEVVLPIHLEAL